MLKLKYSICFVFRLNFLAVLMSAVIFFSCEKENPDPRDTDPEQPSNVVLPDCQILSDSNSSGSYLNKYYYDSTGRLTGMFFKLGLNEHYESFIYNAKGQVIQKDFYSLDSVKYRSIFYNYNANGQLFQYANAEMDSLGGPLVYKGLDIELSYQNGKVSEKRFLNSSQPGHVWIVKYVYQPNNITEVQEYTRLSTGAPLTMVRRTGYLMDNQKNPLTEIHLLNPLFNPVFYSNVLAVIYYEPSDSLAAGITTYTATLQYNAKGYPVKSTQTEVQPQTQQAFFLSYKCR